MHGEYEDINKTAKVVKSENLWWCCVVKIIGFLDIIRHPDIFKDTTFRRLNYLRLQVKPTLLGPTDRAGPGVGFTWRVRIHSPKRRVFKNVRTMVAQWLHNYSFFGRSHTDSNSYDASVGTSQYSTKISHSLLHKMLIVLFILLTAYPATEHPRLTSLCQRGPGFQSRPGYRLILTQDFCSFSTPSRQIPGEYLKSSHFLFLLHRFLLIIPCFHHSTLYDPTVTESLHKS
jgi:hypothetical protein